jgi:hypothetical protein
MNWMTSVQMYLRMKTIYTRNDNVFHDKKITILLSV